MSNHMNGRLSKSLMQHPINQQRVALSFFSLYTDCIVVLGILGKDAIGEYSSFNQKIIRRCRKKAGA